jgi:hypothetical protein
MDLEEFERALAEVGIASRSPPSVSDEALDEILASRSHVRVLRVLVDVSEHINLSGRQVARIAGVARARALQVLRHLAGPGVVTISWTTIHAVYRLNSDHPLLPACRSLFDAERAVAQGARRSTSQPPSTRR